MPVSSRPNLNIVGFQLLTIKARPACCEVPMSSGSHVRCPGDGVMVLRYMYRTKSGAIKTVHEVQCQDHLDEWKNAHGEQLELFAH